MIIWDEYKTGEDIFKRDTVQTTKWQYKELKCLVKYMLINNKSTKEIRDKLEKCCGDDIKYLKQSQKNMVFNKLIQQCKKANVSQENINNKSNYNNNSNIIQCENKKYSIEIVKDRNIDIYKSEMDMIMKINDIKLEKIMFVLLVYAKWLNNAEWFAIMKADLFKEAKLNSVNSKVQQEILCKLIELGFVESSVKKMGGKFYKGKDQKKQMWHIPFISNANNDTVEISFSNYTNFVWRYENYINKGYFECKKCGGVFKQTKNVNKYCKSCGKYERINIKTIICCDCGKEFEVDSKDTKSIRCKKCLSTYIKQRDRIRKQKYRRE